MDANIRPFSHDFRPGNIEFGRGCVSRLSENLERNGLNRAMIVCGSNVGSNPDVIDPVKRGLGDKLMMTFDETTADKYVGTVFGGVELMKELDIDALVSVGGGSSIDTAHVMSAYEAAGDPIEDLFSRVDNDGKVVTATIEGDVVPHFVVPTTFAGADLSSGGGVKLTEGPEGPPEEQVYGSVTNPKLMPEGLFYDPDLFETTPRHILVGSAMNGFNKGIEMLYSRNANPITDASAMHGLRLLRPALPSLPDDSLTDEQMDRIVAGIILVQYGLSPSENTKKHSIIHAFGHGFSQHYEAHQGVVHAITVPHVLRYIFDTIPGRRDAMAHALELSVEEKSDAEIAEAVIANVSELRDSLGLPDQLRTLEGVKKEHLPEVAVAIVEDRGMKNGPLELNPRRGDIEQVLQQAW